MLTMEKNIRVQANVVDVSTCEERTTNEFHFTWARRKAQGNREAKHVIPVTYPGEKFYAYYHHSTGTYASVIVSRGDGMAGWKKSTGFRDADPRIKEVRLLGSLKILMVPIFLNPFYWVTVVYLVVP
jgi:hypothetical protein